MERGSQRERERERERERWKSIQFTLQREEGGWTEGISEEER